MSTTTDTTTTAKPKPVNPVYAKLRDAVAAIEGVTLVDSTKGDYFTAKHGKTTIGYVNGTETSKRFRVDLPTRAGKRERFVVEKAGDVAKAVRKLASFVPAPAKEEK